MQSASLIVTPLRTSICKPMNWLEVSRIAGFHTDLCKKKFWGRTPDPPFQHNSARLSTIITMQVITLYTAFVTKKNMYYTLILLYICTYCLLLRLRLCDFFFLLFTFWGKNLCPPPFPPLFVTELRRWVLFNPILK